jgi:hypothetical protein
MSHYDIIYWTDYVRGLVRGQEHSDMTRHLAECNRCRLTHTLLATVAVRMQADMQYQVPADAVRNARALFSASARPVRSVLQKLAGKLVFESLAQPQLAGVRSAAVRGTRHALYEAGEYSVDVRVESEQGSGRMNMVGQLAVRSQAPNTLDQVPVRLMSGRQLVAEAVSNQFGEFQLNYEPKRQLKLHIPLQNRGERIELQLGSLVPKRRKGPGRKN